jgi:hypothetical protein
MITFREYIVEEKDPHAKVVAKLEDISKKLNKYGHRWGESPSRRMTDWVDEYNDLKQKHKEGAWKAYCDKNKFSYGHDAYDCLA